MTTTPFDFEYEAFAAKLVDGVKEVCTKIAPGDDFSPMLFVQPKAGDVSVFPVGIFGDIETDADKDALALVIAALVKTHGGADCMFGLVITAWRLKLAGDTARAEMDARTRNGISEDPEREEIVCVWCYSPKRAEMLALPIVRRPDAHPLLGECDRLDLAGTTGRFARLWNIVRVPAGR